LSVIQGRSGYQKYSRRAATSTRPTARIAAARRSADRASKPNRYSSRNAAAGTIPTSTTATMISLTMRGGMGFRPRLRD
jgi:hypothetical protein